MDRPGKICPRANDNLASVIFVGLLDSVIKRSRIIDDTVADSPKIKDT
jgi:hypothetical protein